MLHNAISAGISSRPVKSSRFLYTLKRWKNGKTIEMMQKYARFAPEHLLPHEGLPA